MDAAFRLHRVRLSRRAARGRIPRRAGLRLSGDAGGVRRVLRALALRRRSRGERPECLDSRLVAQRRGVRPGGRADAATRPRRSRQAAMLRLLCALLLAGCMRARPELPILNYHSVGDAADDYTVPLAAFEEQLDWLASHGFHTVSLHELAGSRQRRAPLPDKAIILTFDDGKADALAIVLPALRRRGMRATFFVITSLVGRAGYVTWYGVRTLADPASPRAAGRCCALREDPAATAGDRMPGRLQGHALVDQGQRRAGAAAHAGLQRREEIALGGQRDDRRGGSGAITGDDGKRGLPRNPTKRVRQHRRERARWTEHPRSQPRRRNRYRRHCEGGRACRLGEPARALEQRGGGDARERAQEREEDVTVVPPFSAWPAKRGEQQRAGVEQRPDRRVPASLPKRHDEEGEARPESADDYRERKPPGPHAGAAPTARRGEQLAMEIAGPPLAARIDGEKHGQRHHRPEYGERGPALAPTDHRDTEQR